jgi:hypothetical protein
MYCIVRIVVWCGARRLSGGLRAPSRGTHPHHLVAHRPHAADDTTRTTARLSEQPNAYYPAHTEAIRESAARLATGVRFTDRTRRALAQFAYDRPALAETCAHRTRVSLSVDCFPRRWRTATRRTSASSSIRSRGSSAAYARHLRRSYRWCACKQRERDTRGGGGRGERVKEATSLCACEDGGTPARSCLIMHLSSSLDSFFFPCAGPCTSSTMIFVD